MVLWLPGGGGGWWVVGQGEETEDGASMGMSLSLLETKEGTKLFKWMKNTIQRIHDNITNLKNEYQAKRE